VVASALAVGLAGCQNDPRVAAEGEGWVISEARLDAAYQQLVDLADIIKEDPSSLDRAMLLERLVAYEVVNQLVQEYIPADMAAQYGLDLRSPEAAAEVLAQQGTELGTMTPDDVKRLEKLDWNQDLLILLFAWEVQQPRATALETQGVSITVLDEACADVTVNPRYQAQVVFSLVDLAPAFTAASYPWSFGYVTSADTTEPGL
jgi:hypothetical protein